MTMKKNDYSSEEYLKRLDAYWRAANYLGAAQLYLLDNPLLQRPLKKDDVKKYGLVDEGTQRVIDKFMPGRMTIVLKRLDSVDSRHVSGKDTIGIRIPDSSFVLSLIDQTGPLSVTSANLSGQGNTTNEKEVLAQLDGQIDMVVRGQTASATASTVVDLSQGDVRILREGLITKEEIEEVYYENCSRL